MDQALMRGIVRSRGASTGTRIDVDEFLRMAQLSTGWQTLGAFGELHWEGFRRLAQALEQGNKRFDVQGTTVLHQQLQGWVEACLRFEQDLAAHPEIRRVEVVRPLFVVDFGRTGSTFLHNLLALDARARAPRLWELWSPSPPPRPQDGEPDERVAQARARIDLIRQYTPAAFDIHPLEASAPEECQWIMRHGTHYAMLHKAFGYWEWLRDLDEQKLGALFSHYKLQVQHLLLFHPDRYWLSKSQSHLHYLPVLLSTFPDARIVRLHRDPCKIVPSHCSLYKSIRMSYARSGAADGLGELMLDLFADGMRRMIEADRHTSASQVVDILFSDLIADPRATVRRIYDHFGMTFTDQVDTSLRNYLGAHRSPKQAHSYSLEEFGLTREKVMRRAADYRAWLEARTGAGSRLQSS